MSDEARAESKGNKPKKRPTVSEYFSSVLLSTDAGTRALMALREGDSDAPQFCHDALVEFVGEILQKPTLRDSLGEMLRTAISSFAAEELRPLCVLSSESAVENAPKWFLECHDKQQELLEAVRLACDRLNDAHQQNLLKSLISNGVFLNRLENDHSDEKRKIAEYVVATFFQEKKLRCFIQASTGAVHLAEALAQDRKAHAGCLLYTNCVAFPPAYLSVGARHAVYAFCGPVYDDECAAWLYPAGDRTGDELRRLFHRDAESSLDTSFLFPWATTLEEGIFYHRQDTAEFTRVLVEESKHIVIMTPANRVLRSAEEFPGIYSKSCSMSWPELRQGNTRVSLVIGPHWTPQRVPGFTASIAAQGIDVDWYHDDESQWRRATAAVA